MKRSKLFILVISIMIFIFIPDVHAIQSINEEILNGNEIITLDKDIIENVIIPNDKNITINLNNYKISSTSGVTITNNGNLTIDGEGEVIGSNDYVILNNGESLVIKNGYYYSREEISCNNDGTARSGSSIIMNGWDLSGGMVKDANSPEFATLIIDGGNINGGFSSIYNAENGKLTLNAVTITNQKCISPASGLSKSVGVYNKGKELIIKEGVTLGGYLTNDYSGIDLERIINIQKVNIRGINKAGETDHIVYENVDIEDVNVTNKMEFNADTNNLVLKNITAGEINLSGIITENGEYVYDNVDTGNLTFALNQDLTIGEENITSLFVASGKNVTITDSEITTITCSEGTICNISNTSGRSVSLLGRAVGNINDSTFDWVSSTSRSILTLEESTINSVHAFNRGEAIIITGNYGSAFAGRNQLGTVQTGTSSIEINGGTFTGVIHAAVKNNTSNKIIINDGIFNGEVFSEELYPLGGQITIYGGAFNSDYHETVTSFLNTGYEVINLDSQLDIVVPSRRVHLVNVSHINSMTEEVYSTSTTRVVSGMDYRVDDLITLGQGDLLPEGFRLKMIPNNASGTMRDEDINVIFQYDNIYNLTYESNGGDELPISSVLYNSEINLPLITKEGYAFGGWYTDRNYTNEVQSITITDDITVYAKWIKKYKITISYVDENNEKIIDDDEEEILEGDDYRTLPREFDNYTLQEEPNNKNGNNIAGNISVVYRYRNNSLINSDPIEEDEPVEEDEFVEPGSDEPVEQKNDEPVETGNSDQVDPVESEQQNPELIESSEEEKQEEIIMDDNQEEIKDNTNEESSIKTNIKKNNNTNIAINEPINNNDNTLDIPEVIVVPKNNEKVNIDASQKAMDVIQDIVYGNSNEEKEEVKKAIVDAVNDNKTIVVEVVKKVVIEGEEVESIDAIKENLSGNEVVDYYDISVVLTVDNVVVGNLSELEKSIRVTLPLPDDIKEPSENYERQYYVLRLHNGEINKIQADLNDDNTISFDSDKFSLYAISYEDTLINNTDIAIKTSSDKTVIFLIGFLLLFFFLALIIILAARRNDEKN